MSTAPFEPSPAAAGSVPVDAVMAGLTHAVGAAAATQWWSLSDGDALRRLAQMEVLRRQLEAARLCLVADVDARGAAVLAGAKSTRAWLVTKTGVSRHDATRSVKLAADLTAQAAGTRAALLAGELSLDHTRVIAATITTLHSTLQARRLFCGAQVLDSAEATMLDLARSLDPGQLATAGAVLVETLAPSPDPDGDVLSEQVRRVMSITRFTDGGGSFRGELDPEGLALLEAALSPLTAPLPATAEGRDRRTPERRRGDALIDLARRAIAAGDLPTEGGLDTTVVVTSSLDKLRGELVAAEPTLDTGIELPAESVRRLACDAMILAAVLATTGQPLDIGRASRLVPVGIRRALILRDKHCAFPGCPVAAAWCHAHHVKHWVDGGPTALDNLCLLCPHHHRLIHHSDWDVRINPDGLPSFVAPHWVTPEIATADPTWRITIAETFPRRRTAA